MKFTLTRLSMRRLSVFLSIGLVFLAAHAALAENSANVIDPSEGGSSSTRMTSLAGFAPIAIFLVVLLFLFRKQTRSPQAKLQQQSIERYQLHMQRLEELLERIAVQLERRDKS